MVQWFFSLKLLITNEHVRQRLWYSDAQQKVIRTGIYRKNEGREKNRLQRPHFLAIKGKDTRDVRILSTAHSNEITEAPEPWRQQQKRNL